MKSKHTSWIDLKAYVKQRAKGVPSFTVEALFPAWPPGVIETALRELARELPLCYFDEDKIWARLGQHPSSMRSELMAFLLARGEYDSFCKATKWACKAAFLSCRHFRKDELELLPASDYWTKRQEEEISTDQLNVMKVFEGAAQAISQMEPFDFDDSAFASLRKGDTLSWTALVELAKSNI